MEKILIILKTGTIRCSYVDKDMICRYDSLTEQIAFLLKGKRVAITSSHIKYAKEMAAIFEDEYQISSESVSVFNSHLLKFFMNNSKKNNIEVLIVTLDENPDRYFPEFFSEKYLKKVLYLDAFRNGCAWIINLGTKTMSTLKP